MTWLSPLAKCQRGYPWRGMFVQDLKALNIKWDSAETLAKLKKSWTALAAGT